MLKGIFVYARSTALRKDNAFDWLIEEAASCGLTLEICFEDECCIEYGPNGSSISFAGKNMDDVKFVLMRTYNDKISGYYENKKGIVVINDSKSMRVSRDKLMTHDVLVHADLPTPYTVYGPQLGYHEVSAKFGEDRFLVKKNDGCKGEDIYMINNAEEFNASINRLKSNCIFQRIIYDSIGRDVRVWVIGEECAGAILRYSETSFLSNYSQGGRFRPIELDEQLKNLSVMATKAVGLDFAGVDLLYCGDSYVICEVNGNAGFRTISYASEVNIPRVLFKYIHARCISSINQ